LSKQNKLRDWAALDSRRGRRALGVWLHGAWRVGKLRFSGDGPRFAGW